jgi:hypothetical protein
MKEAQLEPTSSFHPGRTASLAAYPLTLRSASHCYPKRGRVSANVIMSARRFTRIHP